MDESGMLKIEERLQLFKYYCLQQFPMAKSNGGTESQD